MIIFQVISLTNAGVFIPKSTEKFTVSKNSDKSGVFYEANVIDQADLKSSELVYVGGITASHDKFTGHLGKLSNLLQNTLVHGYRSETEGMVKDVKEYACQKVAADYSTAEICDKSHQASAHLAAKLKSMIMEGRIPALMGHSQGNFIIREAIINLTKENIPQINSYLSNARVVFLSEEAPTNEQLPGIKPVNIRRITNVGDFVSLDKSCYSAINEKDLLGEVTSCIDDGLKFGIGGLPHKLDFYLNNPGIIKLIRNALSNSSS